jgi:hypothetical protein
MTAGQALDAAQRAVRAGRLEISGHARKRMYQRGAQRADVENAIVTATAAKWQPEHGTWLLRNGVDCDGDELLVAVALDETPQVTTVM